MTAAPVTESGLAAAMRPFGESTMLPAEAYTSDAVLAWERRYFFAGSWICVGRVDALLPDGTTQHACTVGDVPVLLVREPGSADYGRSPTPAGTAATSCSATASRRRSAHWCARTTRGATTWPAACWPHPGSATSRRSTRPRTGWCRCPCGCGTAGCSSTRPGERRRRSRTTSAGSTGLVTPYAPETLTLRARHDYVVTANWKVVTENYHECYHCPLIHPELCQVSPPSRARTATCRVLGSAARWTCATMRRRCPSTVSSRGRPIDGADQRRCVYLGCCPTC